MTESTQLQQLVDREAIRDLLAHYCYLIASGDVDAVIDLFTSDCRVEILGQVYEGASGLRTLYASALDFSPKPYIHNHLIHDLDDRTASSSCVLEIRQIRDGQPETGGGCYEDRYLKEDGCWKFSERRFRVY